jgi:hypothetical protein
MTVLDYTVTGLFIYKIDGVLFSERSAKMAKKKKAARRTKKKRGLWSKGDVNLLKKIFGNKSTAAVAKELGRPLDAVKKKASRMGLTKLKRYMKSIGRA